MEITYRLGGIDLKHWLLTDASNHRVSSTIERTTVRVPGRNGAVPVGRDVAEPRQLTLACAPLRLDGDIAAHEELQDALEALAHAPSLTVQRIVGDDVREAEAILKSVAWENEHAWGRWSRVLLVLELPGVLWRDPAAQVVDAAVDAGVWTIEHAGSGPVLDAVVRLPRSASRPRITDLASGTSLILDMPATEGDTFAYVDLATMRAWETASASAWEPVGTDITAHIDYAPAGPLELWPTVTMPFGDARWEHLGEGRWRSVGFSAAHQGDGRYDSAPLLMLSDGEGRYWPDSGRSMRGVEVQTTAPVQLRYRRSWW